MKTHLIFWMLRQINISNLQNFLHLTSLPACKPEQPCFLKSWKILRVTLSGLSSQTWSNACIQKGGIQGRWIRVYLFLRLWAARQPNGWRNTFRTTAKKTQRHIQQESCAMSVFMHTSFCLEISSIFKYADCILCRYISYDKYVYTRCCDYFFSM